MKKKLLSFSFGHDGAVSYFDGLNLYYGKLERLTKVKHDTFLYAEQLEAFLKTIFNVSMNDIDEICLIDCIDENTMDFKKRYNHKDIFVLDHHYAHCLSVEFLYGKGDISIAIDGEGNNSETWAVYRDTILIDKWKWCDKTNTRFFGGLGNFIEFFLGFYCGVSKETKLTDVAGKFMSLQSYGNIHEGFLKELNDNITMYNFCSIENIFNKIDGKIDKLDIARTFHYFVEKTLLPNFFKQYCKPEDKILYSGGIAQNIVWNTELKKHFPNLQITPHSYDGGLCLGGFEYLRQKNKIHSIDVSSFPYLSISQIPNTQVTLENIKTAAKLLADNKIIGWYQGLSEIGPRALGNRSILMNPMIKNGKEFVNKIKKRENYRPFGASVLKEHTLKYFDISWDSPFMLYTANVKDKKLESITHIDGTCRIQTVDKNNSHFRMLLEEFYKLTGCPILLNTSLNVAGEPIAAYKDQVYIIVENTDIHSIFFGNEIITKKNFL